MAYCDYGARVYVDGRLEDGYCDACIFYDSSKSKIEQEWAEAASKIKNEADKRWIETIHHGVLGNGNIRVMCHKQGLPQIYELINGQIEIVDYEKICVGKELDYYDYGQVDFSYKEHDFIFDSGRPYSATMVEPNGTVWICEYDYGIE